MEKKKSKSEILALWRSLGFLNGLKEGGVVEWRCAKSFDLMANYLLSIGESASDEKLATWFASERSSSNKAIGAWEVLAFPMIRKCVARNSNRVTRVIKPEELFAFLKEKTIGDAIGYCHTLKLAHLRKKETFKFLVGCFERYLKDKCYLERPLFDMPIIFYGDERNKINYIFNGDYEAEVCSLIGDYFCDTLKKR